MLVGCGGKTAKEARHLPGGCSGGSSMRERQAALRQSAVPGGWPAREWLWPHGLMLLALAGLCAAWLSGMLGHVPVQIGLLGLSLVWVFALRDDIFTAAMLIGVHLIFDWYQLITLPKGFPWISLVLALVLTGMVGWQIGRR